MYSTRCQHIVRSLINVPSTLNLGSNHQPKHRAISTSSIRFQNYYDSLGISASSTQNEIKAAYYKLSKIYHPDKNKGSESASKKFQEITAAYEVLSNYRLRRLYDKGIIHTAGSQYANAENIKPDVEDIVEDDPQTKFYKSRFTKSKVTPSAGGQSPIYDFDEWAKAHYGDTLDRRNKAKARHARKEAKDKENIISTKNEISIFGFVICVVVLYLIVYAEQSYDTPKPTERTKTD